MSASYRARGIVTFVYGEDVVGRPENVGVYARRVRHCRLLRLGVGAAVLHVFAHESVRPGVESGRRGAFEELDIVGFRAEREMRHYAGQVGYRGSAEGETLGGRERPDDGQLDDEVGSAGEGALRPHVFVEDGERPPLDVVAAHYRNNVRRSRRAYL